jgi:hypothetical protein
MSTIVNLPTYICLAFVNDWISIPGNCQLNSAFCNKHQRSLLLVEKIQIKFRFSVADADFPLKTIEIINQVLLKFESRLAFLIPFSGFEVETFCKSVHDKYCSAPNNLDGVSLIHKNTTINEFLSPIVNNQVNDDNNCYFSFWNNTFCLYHKHSEEGRYADVYHDYYFGVIAPNAGYGELKCGLTYNVFFG